MIIYAARTAAGVGLGALTALAGVLYLLLGAPLLVVPASRKVVQRGARRLSELERTRLWRYLDIDNLGDYDNRRALQFLVLRTLAGLLGLGVWVCIGGGLVAAVVYIGQLVTGRAPGGQGAGSVVDWLVVAALATMAVFLCIQGITGVAALERRLAKRFLGPSRWTLLKRRMDFLATTRAEVVDAVNDERRRIERDLHDGVQQRLVALGLLLGRARRTGDSELVRQAHEESQEALRELRDVAWRVYPVALDESGLEAALESLAERAVIRVQLVYALTGSPPTPVATVAYFVVSESVTNAVKHAGATWITIDVRRRERNVVVKVTDDGCGGARISLTGGLAGLLRRVAAADGEFTVDSPPRGGTVVQAVLPCG
ncbi:histidine kinase [Amycolatopsis sp. NEAU-NG30]|uniref:histidine kinase n=1 Tax=Amycolatopsis melonis TaxID=3156488 RepID=A0ABV0LTW7_9PSEU